jgi:serine/threonine protein phosphatase 1
MRTFVLGDIHGALLALRQVLDRTGFQNGTDRIIFIGDICDGWPDTPGCIEHLHSLDNVIHIMGNHDRWMIDFLTGERSHDQNYPFWLHHGGVQTKRSYTGRPELIEKHVKLLSEKCITHYIMSDVLFVHGGYIPWVPFEENTEETFLWDRSLWSNLKRGIYTGAKGFREVYIGHTPVLPETLPQNIGNVWNVDTGAAYTGTLTMMDIETKEVFQSDPVPGLYPGHYGRN